MASRFNNWRVATESDVNGQWGGLKAKPNPRFRCYLCGSKINQGEDFLILYTNDIPKAGGNPLICHDHRDNSLESLRNLWINVVAEVEERFWWLRD